MTAPKPDGDDAFAPLRGKTWEELDVIETGGPGGGRVLFRDTIRKRRATAEGWTDVPVMLQVPRKDERRAARLEARRLAADLHVDPDKDPALFEDLDNICILARAIRDPKPNPSGVHDQHCDPLDLERTYDPPSLEAIWERLEAYSALLDPRVTLDTPEKVWGAIAAINHSGSLLPLAAIAGREQPSFLLFMAARAIESPTAQRYFASLASSTPAP